MQTLRDSVIRLGKILLVDDEVAVRNVYQLFLEMHGYTVSSASSVAEALRILTSERLDVLLLDIFLGLDNGLELLKAIVAAQVEVPVIVMSAVSSDDPLFQEAIDSGAAGLFLKSLPLEALLKEIKRVTPESGSGPHQSRTGV